MHTHEAIEQRRSVKHYIAEENMSDQEFERLMDLAILSPTSFNIQNWRFVTCREQATKDRLCAAAWNQAQVRDAALVIVLCGDLQAHAREPDRYWRNAPSKSREILVPMIGQFYGNDEVLVRDEVMRSVGIAAQTIMLAAKAMGYDSCPMVGFDSEQVGKIINLPGDHVVAMMIAIGKAKQPAYERSGQLPKNEVVFNERFPG